MKYEFQHQMFVKLLCHETHCYTHGTVYVCHMITSETVVDSSESVEVEFTLFNGSHVGRIHAHKV